MTNAKENEVKRLLNWIEAENPPYEIFVEAYGRLSMFSAFTCICGAHSILQSTRRPPFIYSQWKLYYEDIAYRSAWLNLASDIYDYYSKLEPAYD